MHVLRLVHGGNEANLPQLQRRARAASPAKASPGVIRNAAARSLLLLVPLLYSCEWATEPVLPITAEQFTAPKVYQLWWNLTEQCSGLSGDFSSVTWFRVPNADEIPLGDGSPVNGRWDAAENRIVLGGDEQWDGDLVRHEMLHALLKSGTHPRASFVGKCGGTVVCVDRCLADAGPAPPPDPAAVPVKPSAISVGTWLAPSAPSTAVNDGTMMLYVTATNPAANSVIVQLPGSGATDPGASFSFDISGPSVSWWYDVRAWAPEMTRFAPGEVKKFIFDFRIGSAYTRYTVPPGTYRFAGAYGGVWSQNSVTATIAP